MKILIIKLGYSETLDSEIGKVPSLGDVLRTTPLLHPIKKKHPSSNISWLVSKEAEPLINNNPYIDRILVWDEFVGFQLMKEKFDIIISLEKIPGVCALVDMIEGWVKYGFRFDSNSGSYHAYENGLKLLDYINKKDKNLHKVEYWQKSLIEMLGLKWEEQEYILGYTPSSTIENDIGINWKVGSKWPVKNMSDKKWEELEVLLKKQNYSISWQQGMNNLNDYIEWINSCQTIITCDSLGLHLALALKKNVVGLFGPTSDKEVFYYNRGESIITNSTCSMIPCYKGSCETGEYCMEDIPLNKIINVINKYAKRKK